jgi:hypothetical protein
MAYEVPDNPKLFNALMNQAVAKYPSHRVPGASPVGKQWAHMQYVQSGGGFTDSIFKVDPSKRDYQAEAKQREEDAKKRRDKNLKARGFVV